MTVKLANNATSRLASPLSSSGTTLSVLTGEGSKFPAITGTDTFPVTLIDATGRIEICRCTARSSDTLTVTRGQENTSPKSFSAGDRVELRFTDGVFEERLGEKLQVYSSPPATNQGDIYVTGSGPMKWNGSQYAVLTGTAASADVTTSATDSTAGRLTKTGDFGVGAKASAPLATNADDWLMPNGVYQVGTGTTGTLPASFGSLVVCGSPGQDSTSNWAQQLFLTTGGDIYYRSSINLAAWSTWRKVYIGDLPGALTGTATIPASGLQNGGYTIVAADAGKFINKNDPGSTTWVLGGGIPTGAAITLVNFGGPITLTAGDTLNWIDATGSAITGDRTLGPGVTTVLRLSGSWIVTGQGIS